VQFQVFRVVSTSVSDSKLALLDEHVGQMTVKDVQSILCSALTIAGVTLVAFYYRLFSRWCHLQFGGSKTFFYQQPEA
jgi:hypothetical protein